jgi:hypothetical protein
MRIIYLLFVCVIFIACTNNNKSVEKQRAELPKNELAIIDSLKNDSNGVFVLIDSLQNLGTLTDGEVITSTFRFKNGGNTLLLIKSVTGSCGCTKTSFPPKPLKPNEEGRIEITFDSKGKSNESVEPITLQKSITIEANTAQRTHSAEFTVKVKK